MFAVRASCVVLPEDDVHVLEGAAFGFGDDAGRRVVSYWSLADEVKEARRRGMGKGRRRREGWEVKQGAERDVRTTGVPSDRERWKMERGQGMEGGGEVSPDDEGGWEGWKRKSGRWMEREMVVEAHVEVEHGGHGLGGGRGVGVRDAARRGLGELLEQRADDEEAAHADGGDEERELAPEGLDEEEDEDGGGYDLGRGEVSESRKRWGRGEEAGGGRGRGGVGKSESGVKGKSRSEEKGEREEREGPRRRGGTRMEKARMREARHPHESDGRDNGRVDATPLQHPAPGRRRLPH
ncbi:hypothetical protein B0H14DRAFT_3174958 [Mycena olivaceomarginata]|nr:hypothetical protein B0H14DRAFT_3174958 [Mycena olivaceomarginata]